MIYRPQFKRCFRATPLHPEGVILQSEHGHVLLHDPVYSHLAPLLNGQYTVEEIVALLRGRAAAVEVLYALDLLQQRGYMAEATSTIPAERAAFWDLLSVDPHDADSRLQDTTVSITSFGDTGAAPLKALLTACGISLSSHGRFRVVLTDDYLREELATFNSEALTQNRAWLLVKPVGTELWIGPLFLPGKTGCWACLAHRLQGARKIDSYVRQKTNTTNLSPLSVAALPSTISTALSIAATEMVKWIVREQNECLEGKIVTFNILTLDKQTHVMVRRPQCPQCGDPITYTANQSAPLVMQSRKKAFTSDGGHRGFAPEETLTALAHHISPITGIVGALRPLTPWVGGQRLTPSFVATQNFPYTPTEDSVGLDSLTASLRSGSGGKGKHPTQAKVSALCEAIERYSGTFQGDEFRLRARYQDLGTAAVHINDCMLYSRRQLTQRTQWNTRGSRSTWVPESFDEEREIEWSPAWSLTANEWRYIPTAYCYYGYSRECQTWFARADSNGCAAGRSKEEAILQGFMELVERDSIALWWYNRLQKPAVDLDSFAEAYFSELRTYYSSLHRDLWVLDITNDMNIPTFAALSRRNDGKSEDLILGFGTHFDPPLAILRALTEMNQWLPVVTSGSPEKSTTYSSRNPEASQWWETATLENQSYLSPDKTVALKGQDDYIGRWSWSDDLAVDVLKCVEIAAAKGLETLILDQTRPDTGLHVVKVMVPGLRHFWPRFGPGRLYDIPVRMGWLKEPLPEDQMNPQHIFF